MRFEYVDENIKPATLMPITIPIFLEVATEPEAIPRFDKGLAFIAAVLFGEIKIAVPVPARANRQRIGIIPEEWLIKTNDARDSVRRDIPIVQSHCEPILSYIAPEKGLKKKRNINGVIIIKPVVDAE